MESIIKYNKPKNNVTISNTNVGSGYYYNTSDTSNIDINIDDKLLWKISNGDMSLVPKSSYNYASGESSVAIGTYTNTINEGELAIGRFNKPESGETLFTIGNGQSDASRSNLIQVGNNNTIINNNLSGGTANFNYVNSQTISANTFNGNNANISAITSNTVNVTNKLTTDKLEAVSGFIKTLLSEDITVDNLTVTKAAHFFKLIIDEIKATQGQIIITPANAVIDKVEIINGNYRCYYKSKDNEKEIYNCFEVNDQVVCQTFNAATGTSYDVSNTYYWRLCVGTGTTTTVIDGETVDCHYVDLSDSDKDNYSNSAPKKGDNIVQLGNRTDNTRQAAIIISAYNTQFLDKNIKAPSIVQYFGINDYNLESHRRNVISKEFNEFIGSFKTSTGDDIEELIEDVTTGISAYLHTAWANSADGSLDFTKTPNGQEYAYIGLCSNNTQSDASLIYSDYEWSLTKGADGADGEFYKLVPIVEKAIVDKNSTLGVQLQYQIAHVSGDSVTNVTASTNGYWIRFKTDNSVTNYNLSTGTTTPSYTNTQFVTNYHKQVSKPVYLTVYLVYGANAVVKDQKTVSVIFSPSATLEVTDEINATVQNHSETLSSHTTSIANLNVSYDSISSTVESNTQEIDSLSGTVTSHTQSISQLQQTSTSLTSTVASIQNQLNQIELTKKVTVDATNLSENYAYPVIINFWRSDDSKTIRCNVSRTLNSDYGLPSWGRHAKGFVINCDWTTKASGWGTNKVNEYWSENDTTRFINDYKVNWTTNQGVTDDPQTPIVGTINQIIEASIEVIYVRGGSKYDVQTSFSNAAIELCATGYTWTNGNATITRPVISISSLVIPRQDAKTYSEILQTADNIQLNVYNELKTKTGIDISDGSITLDADNTTIVGNLNLTDTNNGLTMFDNEGTARVNIQPKKIEDFPIGKYGWYGSAKSETGHTNYSIELNTISLGTIESDYDIAVYYTNIMMNASYNGSTYYPIAYPKLRVQIYCNGTQVKDFGYVNSTFSNSGLYFVKEQFIYTTKAIGTYTIKFSLSSTSSLSSSYTLNASINANIQWDLKAQTQIFTDGLLSQASPNVYTEVKPDRVEMRQGSLGFRLISDVQSPNLNMFNGIQTIANFRGTQPNVYPNWIPFHNYVPTFSCGDGKRNFTYQKINNTNQYKYVYKIDPYNDYGDFLIITPAYNGTQKQDTWVELPATSYVGDGGSSCTLPVGYRITIINCTFEDVANVYVTPNVASQSTGIIVDANRDTQHYTALNSIQTNDTFIYIGSWNGKVYWRQLHDTQ